MSMSALPQRTLIIMPAFNEEAAIPAVIAEVRQTLPDVDVLVVNDGSADSTSERARSAGAAVLDLPFNLGVGGAMRLGFRYAVRNGYDAAVQIDSDGQHDPASVPELLAVLNGTDGGGGADLVIGARFAGQGDYEVRGPRKWAMRMLAAVLSRTAKTRLTDTTSGLKAINRRTLALFARHYPAEYLGDTIEALVIASRSGRVIRQVPVTMRKRAGGVPSQNPWKSAVYLGRAVLALGFALTRPPAFEPQETAP